MNLKLQNVRLSYPNLFEPKSGPEGGEAKYSASLLLDKETNKDVIAAMQAGILATAKAQWGENSAKWHNGQLTIKKADGKAGIVKVCLRDGSEKPDTDGYGDGVMFFSAGNKLAPAVVDRNPNNRLDAKSGRPYSGCQVNVAIRLWAQDNNFGRRVNAQLQAVQFYADGESFGDAPIDPTTVFSNVAEDENPFAPLSGRGGVDTSVDPDLDDIPFKCEAHGPR